MFRGKQRGLCMKRRTQIVVFDKNRMFKNRMEQDGGGKDKMGWKI